jgi:hypothetical protein
MDFSSGARSIHRGIWAFNGIFQLTDAWQEADGKRSVFKFRLELTGSETIQFESKDKLEHTRLIPSAVKIEVWKRETGRVSCVAPTTTFTSTTTCPIRRGHVSQIE